MAIKLNHTIVPAKDKEAAAKFFAQIFGLSYQGTMGHFAPVKVNDELTLDFDNADRSTSIIMPSMSATMNSTRSSGACRMRASNGAATPGARAIVS